MAEWLAGIDIADLVRVEIVRVTLEGTPSAVTSAVFRLHLVDGSTVLVDTDVSGKIYETLVADVAGLNAALWARRRR